MRKCLSVIFIWMTNILLQLNANEPTALENESAQEDVQEFSCIISPSDLLIDDQQLFIKLNGQLFNVKTLQASEGKWIARVNHGRDEGYCPRGHDLCRNCRLCHVPKCRYYVAPCWIRSP